MNNPTLRPRAKSISGTRKRKSVSNGPSSPMKLNGVVQLELTETIEQQIRDEKDQSYESHSDASCEDVLLEGTDDGEDYEDDEEDEGDSDVEFDDEVIKKIYSTPSAEFNAPSIIKGTNLSELFNRHDDDDYQEGDEKENTITKEENDLDLIPPEKNISMVGLGLSGEEGKALRALINPRLDLTQMSREAEKELNTEKRLTFGPGAAKYHPWTSRGDGGINSRLGNEKRGDDIYFIGIIDILQQYNATKRMETFFKVKSCVCFFLSYLLFLFLFLRVLLMIQHKLVLLIPYHMQNVL